MNRWLAIAALIVAAACGSSGTASSERRGELLYVTHCRRCHGEAGEGDGRYSGRTSSPAADLTRSGRSSDEVRSAIVEGIEGTDMVAQPIEPGDLDALVAHVMALRSR